MSTTERVEETNKSLIDKVRAGTSPTPKNRRDKFSYGYRKSNDDAKIRIQRDILDSLKESDGLPALVYPQDYIFDIAHLRTNGNLGELIDDMSNIANPEERFEMVKSENRILRERLHNALQREMKAIKTFQKLAHDNRLMYLKLKDYENKPRLQHSDMNGDETPVLVNGNDCQPTRNYNDEHRKHARLNLDNIQTRETVDQSTSTDDLRKNNRNQITSTEDLFVDKHGIEENTKLCENNFDKFVNTDKDKSACKEKRMARSPKQSRELFKTKSSPSIIKGTVDDDGTDSLDPEVRTRSASLGSQDSEHIDDLGLALHKRSASSGTINSTVNVMNASLNGRLNEKKIISFPNLDVVDEESAVNRSSISSEMTQSASSVESNSPCQTPKHEDEFSEKFLSPPSVSLQTLHLHSQSLPSALNKRQFHSNSEGNSDDLASPENPPNSRRYTADFPRSKFVPHHISTRSLPADNNTKSERRSKKSSSKKTYERESSSEDSDKDEGVLSPATRRRQRYIENNPKDFADDIRKFQKMLNTGQISQISHESDDEEDIIQAYEAARSQRHNSRRRSALVELPASSVQMDLHVTTEEPPGNSEGRKRVIGSHLALEDKRSSRWSSILRNKKKLLLQKDRLRMSEDLKEYLSTITRPTHVASETELSLYKDTHWTHLMSVTDESGKSRRLSQVDNICLPESEMKRREAVWELFHSEVVYLTKHLLVLKECFLEPLRDIQNKGFLVTVDDKKIFSNLEDLCEVSAKFAKDLLHLFKNEQKDQFGSTASVVTAFTKFKWTVHPQYGKYCLSYTKTLHYLETLKRTEHVQDFFKWCESDPRCNRLKLTDLLVAPFQHLTKYPLLLKNIRKRTSEADNQHAPLTTTIKSVEDLIQELEGNVTVIRNYQKLKDFQKNLVWPSVGELDPKSFIPEHLRNVVSHQECGDILASPKRELIYEGPLTLYESAKTEITAFLFDDMLLLTKGSKKNNRLRKISAAASIPEIHGVPSPSMTRKASDYTYVVWKQPLPIDRFILYDLDEYSGNSIKNGFVLVHISRFKQAIAIHTLQASSHDVKNIWISKLRDAQTTWNELIEQEDEQRKNQNSSPSHDRKRNSAEIEYRETDTDSEQEELSVGTNSGSNSNDETSHVFYEEMEMKQNTAETTELDINSNVSMRTRPSAPRRRISRLTSAI
ncbi:rho guanine nucleotide exchange factor 11-like [Dendronephthya gigantea]|uniref:rho guanine nucleotide exchange factor 11-like n=1 Tax=Dendronephthya gigantea TaxID=151771 RepID=UPI00106DC64D|nr:rho guanine nucleotide exchange factor 11-like [Dendronephthya gigantea]XP_028400598.1 rho guanine nucleotide exchange factor 11-like [Dendronephthya gigantea]XP_028400606.1 rho guanine nucleotide exchange factor 11-like [Dendronephthya gigantea]XP_028400613.1 rho guanine nucleotide exchange factor 11-like [Dendronephthya gigantea]XP_028400620.1 rho guanine nucleotide exchange factor 11-like [Dendronephthya gigantea]